MKVSDIFEHEDGTVSISIDEMSQEEARFFIEEGMRSVLLKWAEEEIKRSKIPAILKGE